MTAKVGGVRLGEFRLFYETHVRFVWRSMMRLGVHDNDLGDAVQEVFVVVHRKLADFEGRSKVTTWLFSICIRVASTRRRSARERFEIPSALAPTIAVQSGPGDLAAPDVHRARALIEESMARLPDEQRIVFALLELEGFSGEEIAQSLAIPIGTVRSRLRLARTVFSHFVARIRAQERGGERRLVERRAYGHG